MTRTFTRWVFAATTAVALAATLTACGSDNDADSTGTTEGTTDTGAEAIEAIDFGQTHSIDGLDVSAEITEVFAPNDYANFGDDSPYALVSLTVTNTTDADSDAMSGPLHTCQLDGSTTTAEQYQGITEAPPALLAPGDTVTFPAAACPITTDGSTRGETVDYNVTVNGTTPLWFTGAVPAE